MRTQINSIGTDRPDPAMLISCLLPCGALFGEQNDTVASQRGKFESRNQLNRARSDRSCHVDLMRGSPTEHHEPKGAPQFTTPIPIADPSPAGVSSLVFEKIVVFRNFSKNVSRTGSAIQGGPGSVLLDTLYSTL